MSVSSGTSRRANELGDQAEGRDPDPLAGDPGADLVCLSSPSGHRLWFHRAALDEYRSERPNELRVALERRSIPLGERCDEAADRATDGLYGTGTSGANAVRAASFPPVRMTFLGSCLTQFAEDAVHEAGLRRNRDALIIHRWLGTASAEALAVEHPDVVVIQSGASALLEPIFRASTGPTVRRIAEGVGAAVARLVETARRNAAEATVVVHTIAPPAIWPPTASAVDWACAWEALNGRITEAARSVGAAVLDEVELAYVHGSANLFDDLCFPWAHHGGATDLATETPNQLERVHGIFAEVLWETLDKEHSPTVKAIVTDLDGVLWPGVAAESGFGWLADDSNSSWVHRGIQEALRAYERAGLVLASLSRGDEGVTLGLWRDHARRQPLGPDDFALHSIDWRSKASRMKEILGLLQTTPDRVIFIDDHPAERAAMQAAFPTMRILGHDVATLRAELLGSRVLRASVVPGTGVSRTTTTQAAIRRARDRTDFDEDAFREHLQVKVTIRPATRDDMPRVGELIGRTTQISLGNGWSVDERHLENPNFSIMAMYVADRYSDYGLVGASVVDTRGALLRAYAVSCRVIGLEVSDALLAAHVKHLGVHELAVDLAETSRNGVLRDTLARWGLVQVDGVFRINRKARTDAMDNTAGRTR